MLWPYRRKPGIRIELSFPYLSFEEAELAFTTYGVLLKRIRVGFGPNKLYQLP